MPTENQTPSQSNQGEGNREAARQYNEATREFVERGKVEKAAHDARRSLEGPEAEELRQAEDEGKHARK